MLPLESTPGLSLKSVQYFIDFTFLHEMLQGRSWCNESIGCFNLQRKSPAPFLKSLNLVDLKNCALDLQLKT